jgi:hypothetical protein
MIKFTSNNDFDFSIESVSLITESGQLTKRASAKSLLKYAKTKDQSDLHIIALGAYEGTGFNRNGDMFTEKDCIDNHHYFKDSDRAVHRFHKNKKDDPKYGNIKAAAYNNAMKRIELVVGLDNDKCADILDEQERTGNTNWSMASKQAYDICTWCNHKAKTDKDRCEHIPDKIGEINKYGQMCGMHNPDPRWFEMSYVKRPADRIGMSLGKMASADVLRPMLPSDYLQIYTGFQPPDDEVYISKKASDKRELLLKLAAMEKHVDGISKSKSPKGKDKFIAENAHKMAPQPMQDQDINTMRGFDPSKMLRALADAGIVLNPEDFSKYVFGNRIDQQNVQGMKTHLPHAFSNAAEGHSGEVVNNEKFEPSSSDMAHPDMKKHVNGLQENHSMFEGPQARRIIIITMMGGPEDAQHGQSQQRPRGRNLYQPPVEQTKEAFDKELAKQYVAYKLAALNYLGENNKLTDEVLLTAVIQNRL